MKRALIMIFSAITTIAVIAGFVALCMYRAAVGVPLVVVFCLVLLIYPLYKSKKIKTVEKYIASKKGKAKKMLQEIHDQVTESGFTILPVINNAFIFPTYLYVKDAEKADIYSVLSVQAAFGGKSVRIYTHNPKIFANFEDRLKDYKNNGTSEILISVNIPLDGSLIKDIVKFNIEEIAAND